MEYYVRAAAEISKELSAYLDGLKGSIARTLPPTTARPDYLYSISLPELPESELSAALEGIGSLENVLNVEPAGGVVRAMEGQSL